VLRYSKMEQLFLYAIFNIKVTELLHKMNYYQLLRGDNATSSQIILFADG